MRPSVRTWAKEFGARVRHLRKDLAHLSQRGLAERLGLSLPDTVTRIERGVAGRVALSVLKGLLDLAAEHGAGASWLLTGKLAAEEAEAGLTLEETRCLQQKLADAVEGSHGRDLRGVQLLRFIRMAIDMLYQESWLIPFDTEPPS